MTVYEIKKSAARIFYGKYKSIAICCMIVFIIMLVKKVSELAGIYFIVSSQSADINDLISYRYVPWNIFISVSEITGFIFSIPAITDMFRILAGTKAELKPEILNLKSAFLYVCIRIINLISFLPSAICLKTSFRFLSIAYHKANGEGYVSVSFMLAMLSVIFLWLWAYIMMGTVLSPFILVRNPQENIFSAISGSFINMNGRRFLFIKLILNFLPYMILFTAIPLIPFIIPRFLTWYSVFAVKILEDERNCCYKKCKV